MPAHSLSGRSTRTVRIERGPEWPRESQEASAVPEREADEHNRMAQSLRFTQFVVDRTADAVFWLQSDGRLIYANGATRSMLGYSWEELLGMKVYEIDAQISKDTWRESWESLRAVGSHTKESQFRTKAGTLVPVEVTRDSLEYDGKEYVCAIARDITERKWVERELRKSEARYRAIVEDQTEFVCRYLPDGTLTFVNDAICRFLDQPREAFLGKPYAPYVHPDDLQMVEQGLAALTPESPVVTLEQRHVLPTGEIRWGQWTSRGIFTKEGELSEIQSVGRDITQRKKAAEALEAAQVELRQREAELAHLARVASMGEMAAALAHEMNQPLHAITNYAYGARRRLRKPGADPAAIAEAVAEIASEARRASQIIDRLRKFLRNREPRISTANINDVVRDVARLLEYAALDRGVTVRLALATRLPPLRVDSSQVQQVLVNLVRNAFDALIDAAPGRREVTLATRLVDENRVELSVADTGTGFAENVKEKMFEGFFTTKREGMGMGLAISRTIVEAHGGEIWAEANSPQGAVFRFTLPVFGGDKE